MRNYRKGQNLRTLTHYQSEKIGTSIVKKSTFTNIQDKTGKITISILILKDLTHLIKKYLIF